MKKHTGEQPIDELFARKLGNMSLPPSPNGFERLKARMDQSEPETRIVFWRNPTIQRYMAAAACLLLVSLFGWLYWPSDTQKPDGVQVAENKSKTTDKAGSLQKQAKPQVDESTTPAPQQPILQSEVSTPELVQVDKTAEGIKPKHSSKKPSSEPNKAMPRGIAPTSSEPVLAQTKSREEKNNLTPVNSDKVTPNIPAVVEQVAEAKTPAKPAFSAEHVLDVTIAEPASLIAARQAAKDVNDDKSAVATNDNPEKGPKSGSLWQQVKRFKQGEVLARRDNAGDEDRGLLGRAYSGLKQSFEKDKPVKQ